MKKQTAFTPEDGLAYTIHLRNNGLTIYNAVYHHCALSGKHYFTKGDNTYPIEDIYSHSAKGHEIKETRQVLTDTYCGHLIQVTLTSVIPENTLTQIPDSVYDCIMEQLKENVVQGSFTEEETGNNIYIQAEGDHHGEEIYTVVAGSWQVIPQKMTPNDLPLSITSECEVIDVQLCPNKTPVAYQRKLKELVEIAGMTEDEAKIHLHYPIQLELFYHYGLGLFAVEPGAVESTEIYDPYTGEGIPKEEGI